MPRRIFLEVCIQTIGCRRASHYVKQDKQDRQRLTKGKRFAAFRHMAERTTGTTVQARPTPQNSVALLSIASSGLARVRTNNTVLTLPHCASNLRRALTRMHIRWNCQSGADSLSAVLRSRRGISLHGRSFSFVLLFVHVARPWLHGLCRPILISAVAETNLAPKAPQPFPFARLSAACNT